MRGPRPTPTALKVLRRMAANVEGYRGPLLVQQFQGGASNPTFLLTDATGDLLE